MASGTSCNFRRSRPLIQAIFTSFPTTLHHYRPSRNLTEQNYYRSAHAFYRDHEVVVYKDGLVYPAVNGNDSTNRAVMYTDFIMQKFARAWIEMNISGKEVSCKTGKRYVYTIPEGTPIPNHLILIQEWDNSRFSLQPAHGIPLTGRSVHSLEIDAEANPILDLNQALGEFYNKHATRMKVRKWIKSNPCQKDLESEAEKKWMKRWMGIRNIRQGR
ncbi:hypothetical protein TGAM01_v210887 [Trichoderma gamsii]|uniref:Tse2 ADP-ribosyltransferase toxin domain-containing protein n=1 Tax=Trichoderma gamsii TaxID=398673 RepID=A0A2P4Z7I5_9HYPO|nr:hypothetical protein TGAM01_v210887 [Trichoderma gamsii]PON20245.1 hypothetical protein TGAM01_v210887 [Trichoderma gamsii]